jgi:hypothetical protein
MNQQIHTFQSRSLTLKAWAEFTGIGYSCLKSRISAGMPLEQALSMPVRRTARNYTSRRPESLRRKVTIESELARWLKLPPPRYD